MEQRHTYQAAWVGWLMWPAAFAVGALVFTERWLQRALSHNAHPGRTKDDQRPL